MEGNSENLWTLIFCESYHKWMDANAPWVQRTILHLLADEGVESTGRVLVFQTQDTLQELAISLVHRMAGMSSSHSYI